MFLLELRRYESPDLMEIARITPVRAIGAGQTAIPPAAQQTLLPELGLHRYMPITFRDSRGSIVLPPPSGTQLSLFKKGGKVHRKVRKCENGTTGLPDYIQGFDLGIRYDSNGNVVVIDPKTGLPKVPTIGEMGAAVQLREESKTATPSTTSKEGSAIDLDKQSQHTALRRNSDGSIATRTGTVVSPAVGTGTTSITTGTSQKAGYNFFPLVSSLGSFALSAAGTIASANKTKSAIDDNVESQKYNPFYESGQRYDESALVRARDTAKDSIDSQPMMVSNDPNLQRAYELEKAKAKSEIDSNFGTQQSANISK